MTVNSYYKSPNQPFDFRSSTIDTPVHVIIGSIISNRRFYVEINGKKSKSCNQKNGLPQGRILSPVLFNVYIKDQPVHNETYSFIYADDLCIATQHSTFEQTETIFPEASNHQNNSSYTLLLYGGICVSCVGKFNTRNKTLPRSERSVSLHNRMSETNIY